MSLTGCVFVSLSRIHMHIEGMEIGKALNYNGEMRELVFISGKKGI